MFDFDSGEPFGLPKGTVRGIIALAFSGVTLGLFATTGQVPMELLPITTLIIGNYFGVRSASEPAEPREEPVAPPAIGEDG